MNKSTKFVIATAFVALNFAGVAVVASDSTRSSSFLRKKNTRLLEVTVDTTESSLPSCNIDISFGECPIPEPIAIDNGCDNPFQVVTFRYNGGNCAQSENLLQRHDFTCDDYNINDDSSSQLNTVLTTLTNEAVPSKRTGNRLGASSASSSSAAAAPTVSTTQSSRSTSSQSTQPTPTTTTNYITVTSRSGNETYFAGTVAVGEEYTLNAREEYPVLMGDMTITIYENEEGGTMLQQTHLLLDCTNPLFLFDKFGANQVTYWKEITTGREVSVPDFTQTGSIPITVTNPSSSSSTTRLVEMSLLSNIHDDSIDYTSEVTNAAILQPGQSLSLSDFVFDYEYGTRTRYTLFTTVIGNSTDGKNQQCHDSAVIECIL